MILYQNFSKKKMYWLKSYWLIQNVKSTDAVCQNARGGGLKALLRNVVFLSRCHQKWIFSFHFQNLFENLHVCHLRHSGGEERVMRVVLNRLSPWWHTKDPEHHRLWRVSLRITRLFSSRQLKIQAGKRCRKLDLTETRQILFRRPDLDVIFPFLVQ